MTINLFWVILSLIAFITYYLVLRMSSHGLISRRKSVLWSVLMVLGVLGFSFGMQWLVRLIVG